ncbi:MAG TPA: C45 family peptidase, partial [Trueperaceae bacterium]|nr:C45 family peptidase [Trueperaceae bacterium]
MNVPVLEVGGAPYDLGLEHGKAMARQIAAYAAERVALAGTSGWTGRDSTRAEVLAVAAACLERHADYVPRLVEELRGVAAGSGVALEELLIAGGFTDFVDTVASWPRGAGRGSAGNDPAGNDPAGYDPAGYDPAPGTAGAAGHLEHDTDDCTAFLVPASRLVDAAGRTGVGGALAQTWDMHEGSAEHLLLLRGRPHDAPDFVVYTTAGCLGMIGMNEAGLCVGINNLLAADGRVGVTWPFAVRAMLEQETTAAALRVLLETPLAGGHNYLVMDASGAGANVEAMPTRQHVTLLEEVPLVHANHCLYPETKSVEREREAASQANSEARQADAERLLDRQALSVTDLQAVTADQAAICRVGTAPSFVGTCGAVV